MKKNRSKVIFLVSLLVWAVLFFLDRGTALKTWSILKSFLLEMVQVLPFVLVITALVNEWVPAEAVKTHLGDKSRLKGALFAYLLGSLSAGPIYAAFPVCLALKKKGASIRNITILISTWAVIKIPMLFMELKSLGVRFTAIRYGLTLPTIFILGELMNRLVKNEQLNDGGEGDGEGQFILPGRNCGACGYKSCELLRQAMGDMPEELKKRCIFLNN